MSEPTDDDVPPLGEPTPAPLGGPRSATLRGNAAAVGAVGLVVGMLAGFGVARLTDGAARPEDHTSASSDAEGDDRTPATTAVTVPQECVETIRSAQMALAVFDRGVQAMRNLDLAALERARKDLQDLRPALDGRLERCVERVAR